MTAAAVELRAVNKIIGATPVLRQIDFSLEPGAVAVIVGSNGAGKSTLVRIIGGLSRATTGEVRVFGVDGLLLDANSRRRIGIITHQSWLYPNLTARENLEFFAELNGVPGAHHGTISLLERVGLAPFKEHRVATFSRGMEQRLALARAMLGAPDLLLLDEPFAALDPDGVAVANAMIEEQVSRGCAIVITAHIAPSLAVDAIAYQLQRGRLIEQPDEPLRSRLRSSKSGAQA